MNDKRLRVTRASNGKWLAVVEDDKDEPQNLGVRIDNALAGQTNVHNTFAVHQGPAKLGTDNTWRYGNGRISA